MFCLNFAVVEDVFGETQTKELKPNGENISVTKENREEYVKLYCDYILNKSVDRLYQAFHAGKNYSLWFISLIFNSSNQSRFNMSGLP